MNSSKITQCALWAILFALIPLYGHVPAHPQTPAHPLAETHTALSLFSKNGIYEKLNYTHTSAGAEALRVRLETPTSNVGVLTARQNLIKLLAEDAQLKQKLTDIVKAAAKHEQSLHVGALDQKTASQLYFTLPLLNKLNASPATLTALGYTYPVLDFMPVFTHTITPLILLAVGVKGGNCKSHSHSHGAHKGAHAPSNNLLVRILTGIAALGTALHSKEIAAAPAHYWSTPSRYTGLEGLHSQLTQVAQHCSRLHELYNTLKDNPEFTSTMEHWQVLKNLCTKTNISDELKQLTELLESNTFKGNFSRFIQAGNILVAYKLLQKVAPELAAANKALGEIDLMLNCVELVQQHGFCYGQYIESAARPYIKAVNFDHPLLIGQDTIKNSITLGGEVPNPRNTVLSGPNKCGKSTTAMAMQCLAYCLQTLGIGYAQECIMTPFDAFVSQRNIKDQIGERSLLEAEALKAQAVIDEVAILPADRFALVTLDEPIRGTGDRARETITRNLLEDLLPTPNIISLTTTHCRAATEVADQPACECINYTLVNHQLKAGVGNFDKPLERVNTDHPHLQRLLRARA